MKIKTVIKRSHFVRISELPRSAHIPDHRFDNLGDDGRVDWLKFILRHVKLENDRI